MSLVATVASESPPRHPAERVDAIDIAQLSRREATELLLARAATSEGDERRSLEDQIVEVNLQIAVDVARRYRSRGIPIEDLEQVACLGLVKAARGYDPERATDFLSYAVPTIRGEVRRYFRDHGWTVRPPRTVQQAQARITAVESDLCQELGRSPRPSELAERLELDLDLVVEALAANGCFSPTSLDATPVGAEGGIGERLGEDDESFDSAEARVALKPLLAHLDRRERIMLEMRFFKGATQSEIGEVLGITQMQVSRLLSALLARLRDELGSPT
ncbi:MAG TPA: SigB/SigF/SigG family RNA polymerase sigma factor [Nocardioides sp.]|nr:SigB/SigF/SigG family RNA polymerase sigma factor [Nocardioides sp.]